MLFQCFTNIANLKQLNLLFFSTKTNCVQLKLKIWLRAVFQSRMLVSKLLYSQIMLSTTQTHKEVVHYRRKPTKWLPSDFVQGRHARCLISA